MAATLATPYCTVQDSALLKGSGSKRQVQTHCSWMPYEAEP